MQPIAAQYEAIRESSPYGRERTKGMSDLVHQAQHIANLGFVSSDAVEQLFNSNQDGTRIMALGLMRDELRFANPSIFLRVIRQPRSSFEQCHALRVAEDLVARQGMSSDELEAIREAIAVAERNGTLLTGTNSSQLKLAERILAAMPADRRHGGAQ